MSDQAIILKIAIRVLKTNLSAKSERISVRLAEFSIFNVPLACLFCVDKSDDLKLAQYLLIRTQYVEVMTEKSAGKVTEKAHWTFNL